MHRRVILIALLALLGIGCASGPPPVPRERMSRLVVSAMSFVGVPYRTGGNSAQGFDCSGFTQHLFARELGLRLPRQSHEQAVVPGWIDVPQASLEAGDLVFFNTQGRNHSHVGIYAGDDRFVHSPREGAAVRIERFRSAYWTQRFSGARRPPGADRINATAAE